MPTRAALACLERCITGFVAHGEMYSMACFSIIPTRNQHGDGSILTHLLVSSMVPLEAFSFVLVSA